MSIENFHLAYPKCRSDMECLRAGAVLSIVISHAFFSAIKGSFIGVEIFFGTSGFLIPAIIFESLSWGAFSFEKFHMRRLRPILGGLF